MHRRLVIVEAVVAEDPGFGIIRGFDFRAAVDDSVRLVEIHGGRDIVRDDSVFLPELANAIDLDGEHHGDADAVKLARQQNDSRTAPALAKKHDMGRRLFLVAKHAVVIGIQ